MVLTQRLDQISVSMYESCWFEIHARTALLLDILLQFTFRGHLDVLL